MPNFEGIIVKKNGELRMSLEHFQSLKPDGIYKHLVARAK